ncbi:hypothetical protein VNO77_34712 [Canavalia gladiata]|uniref:CID domain-containing protein n=1 Tax=Canavalia gladiata TaxID=3824 RepID=A0AAN9KFU4_CANGL
MGNDIFDGQMLAEKLLKLNNSQQSIESLSCFCVSHRKSAKEIVETWDKLFSSSQKEKRISFLYLANDILQNSRRKGSEFVNEFWKVLPATLRHVYESDEHGKKVVTRLVDIWEERKVFGSRGHGLKDEIMGKNTLPSSTNNGKSSNPIKIVKRDANSVRLKLAVGCLPEKLLTSLHSVHDEHLNEEAALDKCNAVVHQVGKLVEDAENTLAQGNQLGSSFINDLQEQEKDLKQYMVQLENAKAGRATLLSQLKDALQEQESRQEVVHTQLQSSRSKELIWLPRQQPWIQGWKSWSVISKNYGWRARRSLASFDNSCWTATDVESEGGHRRDALIHAAQSQQVMEVVIETHVHRQDTDDDPFNLQALTGKKIDILVFNDNDAYGWIVKLLLVEGELEANDERQQSEIREGELELEEKTLQLSLNNKEGLT